MRTLLHVGCGRQSREVLPPLDFETAWREVRLDIDPACDPDIVDDIATLSTIADGSVDLVFSKHNIEHLDRHHLPGGLASFCRVLKDTGFAVVRTPDLEAVCRAALAKGLETPLYNVDLRDEGRHTVTALDILFGASWAIERGAHFMAHHNAFTQATLKAKLLAAGFERVDVRPFAPTLELRALALKRSEGNLYWSLK